VTTVVKISVDGGRDQQQEDDGDNSNDPETKGAAELGRRGRVF
jgi:hypothetical protein